MKNILAFLFLIALTGCSKKMLPSEHFHTKDSTTTFLPGIVDVPDRNEEFDVQMDSVCQEIARRNEILSMSLDVMAKENGSLIRVVDSVKNLPPVIYKSATGSVAFKPTGSGKATITCHEDEWKHKYDSAIQRTTVFESDSTIIYRNVCENGFHSFAVKWFWITVAFVAGFVFYKLRRIIL